MFLSEERRNGEDFWTAERLKRARVVWEKGRTADGIESCFWIGRKSVSNLLCVVPGQSSLQGGGMLAVGCSES